MWDIQFPDNRFDTSVYDHDLRDGPCVYKKNLIKIIIHNCYVPT